MRKENHDSRRDGARAGVLGTFNCKEAKVLIGETIMPQYIQLAAMRGGGARAWVLGTFNCKGDKMLIGEAIMPRYIQLAAMRGGGARARGCS